MLHERSLLLAGFFLALLALGSSRPDPRPGSDAEARRVELCRAHYSEVLRELEDADVSALSAAQRAERAQRIQTLRRYSERGVFGRTPDELGARVPQFVDREQRLCAVAELLHASDEPALIEEVRRADNSAWVCDLAGHTRFLDWLGRSGLSLAEAARIQVPGTRPPSDTGGGGGGSGGGSSGGSGDSSGGSGGSSGGSGGGPDRSGGGSGTPSSGGGSFGGGGVPSFGGGGASIDATDSWWLWWEYNKLAYLAPNRLGSARDPGALDGQRAALTPWLVEALPSGDALLRRTLAVTLGRTAGAAAVASLERLLDDPSAEVRHNAILGLGATGTPEAAAMLLAIARHGTQREKGGTRISPLAVPLAIVALGLGRRAGFGAELDAEIVRLVGAVEPRERERTTTAAMIYHTLAPSPELHALALRVALDEDESMAARCRAIESLRGVSDPAELSKLQDLLSSSRLELRRSAALALGGAGTPLALPALMTAFELEAEPMTRGFLLIAIGELGGPAARKFLLKELTRGEKSLRRWSALGLGIATRDGDDPDVRDALRAALEREKNKDALGAYWIALGLTRDEKATRTLAKALTQAANPRMRMYAATSLALVGTEEAHAALTARLADEESAMVRVTIAQALGELGRPADAEVLLGVLDGLREPGLQGLAAVAFAFHGSNEALHGLVEMARGPGSSVKRAAAIDGVGMLLGRTPPLTLGEVSRRSNFTVSPDWVLDLYQVTL